MAVKRGAPAGTGPGNQRPSKQARTAFLDAHFGLTSRALPPAPHAVYQVATETITPEPGGTVWRASPPRSSRLDIAAAKDFTNVRYNGVGSHYIIALLLNGNRCRGVVDCGASTSLISRGLAETLGLRFTAPPADVTFKSAAGTTQRFFGALCDVQLTLHRHFELDVSLLLVTDSSTPLLLLGNDLLRDHPGFKFVGLIPSHADRYPTVVRLLDKNRDA